MLPSQIEENIGSTEEQSISNRFDTFTKNKVVNLVAVEFTTSNAA